MSEPRLLVFAYSCAPGLGSEPGAGWGMVTALNEVSDPVVLVGARHMPAVREWEATAPPGSPRFVEVPEPRLEPYMRWHRIPRFLVYLWWLRRAKKVAGEIIASEEIDAVSHVTFSAYWLPTPATELGLPSIWGPVGGAVVTPRQLWQLLGPVGLIQEALDYGAVRIMSALPAARRTAVNATVRIVQNQQTLDSLPAAVRQDAMTLNHALFNTVPETGSEPDGRYALWVSPMQSRKGPRLAVEALARTRGDVKLIMVGDGPQRGPLERVAEKLGIGDRITFTGWIDRDEAVGYMKGATTAIFTGLREEGGLALAEAMQSARRLIVLDHGGAGAIARRATQPDRVSLIQPADMKTVATAIGRAIDDHFAAPEIEATPLLDRTAALAELAGAVARAAKD